MITGIPRTIPITKTWVTEPPLTTEPPAELPCLALHQCPMDTDGSCIEFGSALCWDSDESTWGLRAPLSCLSSTERPEIPEMIYTGLSDCPVGRTIAMDAPYPLAASCCPSGFTWSTTLCLSILTQGLPSATDTACGGEPAAFGRSIDRRKVPAKVVGSGAYRHGLRYHNVRHGLGNQDGTLLGGSRIRSVSNSNGLASTGSTPTRHRSTGEPTVVTVIAAATVLTGPGRVNPSVSPAPPDNPPFGLKVIIGSLAVSVFILISAVLVFWRRKRMRERSDEPAVKASQEDLGHARELGKNQLNQMTAVRSESEYWPRCTLRDSHDDCLSEAGEGRI
ncbi:hypothetical protein GGS20DRAFT_588738 [Poronia punctata]|nr:hypothetical protein GGS20DRAFT_588738 [Poronia punctata]